MSRRHGRSFGPGQLRADTDTDIREEIELYLELRTRELVEQGLDEEEARRVAEDRFGDRARIASELKREARKRRSEHGRRMTMSGLKQDLAYAFRTLRRSPGFTAVAVLTLGLAIGGNTAIYGVVEAALLRAMPFHDAGSLVFLNGYHLDNGAVAIRYASYPEFRDWRERARSITSMAAVSNVSLAASGGDGAESLETEIVSSDYFNALQVEAVRGRLFLPEEYAEPDAHPVVVISSALWDRRFGRDPAAIGGDLILNDRPLTVVGVLPEDFRGLGLDADAWLPEGMMSLVRGAEVLNSRGSRFLDVIGRLAPGATVEGAQQELDVIARDLQREYPRLHEDRFAQVEAFRKAYVGSAGPVLWVLFGAGGVLLLIASANVANLLLVRSYGRMREMVLRRALGAEGRRVGAQLLTESLVLAGLGGAVGLVLAAWGLTWLTRLLPEGVLPAYVQPSLSVGAFAFSFVVLVVIGVATGLVPALSSARMDIASRLREGGRGAAGGGFRRFRPQHGFVVAQVALALVLLVGAGLLTRSFQAQLAVDTGADLAGVFAFSLQLPRSRYPAGEDLRTFVAELERRVGEVPGVEHAAVSSDLPFRTGFSASFIYRDDARDDPIRYNMHIVTPAYFETLAVELEDGRPLTADDVDGGRDVMLISSAMAQRVFPEGDAIGRRMYLSRSETASSAEIVGVVRDVRYRNLTQSMMLEANSPDVFYAFSQLPTRYLEVSVRARTDPTELVPALRGVVASLDPDLPIYEPAPLVDAYRAETATPRFAALLMSVFSALALVLACVGIYGVLAFTVGQRTKEIAIRRAIGATGGRVARGVVADGLNLTAIGFAVGVVGAVGASRLLATFLTEFLFEVTSGDPVTYAWVTAVMIAVSVLAATVPASRAMRRDPAEALTAE